MTYDCGATLDEGAGADELACSVEEATAELSCDGSWDEDSGAAELDSGCGACDDEAGGACDDGCAEGEALADG